SVVKPGRAVAPPCVAVRLKRVCFHKQSHSSVISDRRVGCLILRLDVLRAGHVVRESTPKTSESDREDGTSGRAWVGCLDQGLHPSGKPRAKRRRCSDQNWGHVAF